MSDKLVIFHLHSQHSNGTTNIDSITPFKKYIAAAKECGMKALAFSEHGNLFEWLHKKEAIEAAGMKYIHAVEAYLTEELYVYPEVPEDLYAEWSNMPDEWVQEELHKYCEENKRSVRDNYHCVLIAKNYDGVRELNQLMSVAANRKDGHYYFVPRVTFDELFETSDNILISTACLGGVLNSGTSTATEKFLQFLIDNKHRCWLEIQHHNCKDQIEYNRYLHQLSKSFGIPLIAGTDTHYLDGEQAEGRKLLQRAKDVFFSNEAEWDLGFKNYEQLIESFRKQGSLPMDVVEEAIHNTTVMADMVEEFSLDYSPKYPQLYADPEKVFRQKIEEGIVKRGIDKYPNLQEYLDRIEYEFATYKHNDAINFMLLEEDYKSEMRRRNIKFGYSRGSVSGSIIAYLLGITEIDSVKYNLNFERKILRSLKRVNCWKPLRDVLTTT